MNKIRIAVAAAGVLFLAGCGCQNKTAPISQESPSAPKTEEKSPVSNVINSIKDAMLSGKTMKCAYSVKGENGSDFTYTTYVSGKKYKNEFSAAGTVQHVIFDGETMYSWAEGQKQGIKMTLACSEELVKNVPTGSQNAPTADPSGEKTFDNAVNVKCEDASNVDFSVPSDINFADQCEALKNLQNMIPSNLPGMPQTP